MVGMAILKLLLSFHNFTCQFEIPIFGTKFNVDFLRDRWATLQVENLTGWQSDRHFFFSKKAGASYRWPFAVVQVFRFIRRIFEFWKEKTEVSQKIKFFILGNMCLYCFNCVAHTVALVFYFQKSMLLHFCNFNFKLCQFLCNLTNQYFCHLILVQRKFCRNFFMKTTLP